MQTIRPSNERGQADFGWLQSRHSFSFGRYFDPDHMGFGPLRVINQDKVAPGAGFGTHGHQDMEILSVVLDGGLEHKDSMGKSEVIRPGDIQRMTAGAGVQHSEYNASKEDPVHFLQIWIVPEEDGLTPSYEQKALPLDEAPGKLRLLGSRDGREGSVTIHRDVDLYGARLAGGESLFHVIGPKRGVWVQMIRGSMRANGDVIVAGDGLALIREPDIRIDALDDAEFLMFDMAL